jgi:uncharacterized membrane protein
MLFLALLLVGVPALLPIVEPARAVLIGFDLAVAGFVLAAMVKLGRASADGLRDSAARNDAGRILTLVTAAALLFVVLVVIAVEVEGPRASADEVVLVVATLASAWIFGNTMYAIHYAHLFYDPGPEGRDQRGLGFPETPEPRFSDFCYFAFGVGMTFQVSDVQVLAPKLRIVVTAHALFAFFFNLGILALSVNMVAATLSAR